MAADQTSAEGGRTKSSGPLAGLRVVEMAGLGPAPFGAMLLSDLGADVVRIDRGPESDQPADQHEMLNRGRRSLCLNLKDPNALEVARELIARADVVLEGFRPGVMERLGLGPDECLAANPRLIFARMTGWGQTGPLAKAPGHDINYIALAGVLAHIGPAGEKPSVPLNLVGDFGAGGMMLAFGVCAALVERSVSGAGQVVDAAMVDGSALLMSMMRGFQGVGLWNDDRGSNLLDGGAHFYDTYECSDGRHITVGSIEPQFYAALIDATGVDWPAASQFDRDNWPAMSEQLATIFKSKSSAEWCTLLDGSDVCFAPVLTMDEATKHPHLVARATFSSVDGVLQPSPAPRFSRTPPMIQGPPVAVGADSCEVLAELGYDDVRIGELRASGAFG